MDKKETETQPLDIDWKTTRAEKTVNCWTKATKEIYKVSRTVILLEARSLELRARDLRDYKTNLFAWKNGQRTFKYLKSLQIENFLSRIVNSETNEVATNDYDKAEFFNKYFVSIVTDPDYSIFIPTKQFEFGDFTLHINEFEISDWAQHQ